MHLRREPWLLDFDQESHTYAVFDETVAKLKEKEKEDAAAAAPVAVEDAGSEKVTAAPRVMATELLGVSQA